MAKTIAELTTYGKLLLNFIGYVNYRQQLIVKKQKFDCNSSIFYSISSVCTQLYVDDHLYYIQKTKTHLYAENRRKRLS